MCNGVKQQNILNTHITHTHGELIVYPCSVAVVVVVSVQRSLGPNFMQSILRKGWRGGVRLVAMPIYDKNREKYSPSMKLGM